MKNFKIIIPVSLILIVTFTAFYPCLKNSFVVWDDVPYVTNNIIIQNFSFHSVKQIFTSFFVGHYQPVTMLSYLFEHKFFKLDPFGYHLTNLALHLFNCLLVFWLIYMLTRKVSISSLTALLFGIHPLHVESVAWIAERKDVLYALFFLAAIISYCYCLRERKVRRYYLLSLALFILSLLSKSMAVTLPLVLLLIDYFFHRKPDKRALIDKIPFLILSFIFGAIAVIAQHYTSGAIRSGGAANFFNKIGIVSYDIIFYLNKILAPVKLSCFYPYSDVKDILPLPSYLAVFIILLTAVILSGKYTRKVIFGSAFFLITILPVLKFIPIGGTIVADRYTYVSSIGIFYILAEWAFWLFTRKIKYSRLLQCIILASLIAVTGVLASLTWKRCQVWRDGISLWDDVLNKYPNIAGAYNNRGLVYISQGNIQQAISDYDKAIAIVPNYAEAYNNRGIVYMNQGNLQQAISDFNKAIAIKPSYAEAYDNRGNAYYRQGDFTRAFSDYTKAIEINPNDVDAYFNRGLAHGKQGGSQQAFSDLNKAIEINPNSVDAYCSRGIAYSQQGNFTQAIPDFSRAIKINPNYAEAYNSRGNAYYQQGNFTQAFSDFNKAIAIKPSYAEAYNKRGNACYRQGNFTQAFSDYTKAIENDPNYVDAYCSRGTAYSQQGNFTQAILDLSRAITINPNLAEAYNNRGISFYMAKEYDKAWADVHKAEALGYAINPEFLKSLKKASGREK